MSVKQSIVKNSSIENFNAENINQTVIQGENFFEEFSFEEFESKDFLKDFNFEKFKNSNSFNDIAGQLASHHMIFLAKDRQVRKFNLSYLISYLLSKEEGYLVKGVSRSSDYELSLQWKLHKSEKRSIFILPNVSSQTFMISLEDIREIARQKNHYVILTTEEARETWQVSEDIPFKENFDCDDFQGSKYLINDLSDEQNVHRWYNKEIESHERLMAIALSLFDELYGDQFFCSSRASC